jgi:uncharacterized membrane protein YhaH (DUF805 family)
MSKAVRLYFDYWKNILPWTLALSAVIVLLKIVTIEFKPSEFELVLAVLMICILALVTAMFAFATRKISQYQLEIKRLADTRERKALHANSKADKVVHA